MSPLPYRLRAVGLAALRDAQHRFALPPQVALLVILEPHGGLRPPSLELGDFAAGPEFGRKVPRASARIRGWPARRCSPFRERSSAHAGLAAKGWPAGAAFRDFAQRDQQQRLVDPVEPQQLGPPRPRLSASATAGSIRRATSDARALPTMISAGRSSPNGMKKVPLPPARRHSDDLRICDIFRGRPAARAAQPSDLMKLAVSTPSLSGLAGSGRRKLWGWG